MGKNTSISSDIRMICILKRVLILSVSLVIGETLVPTEDPDMTNRTAKSGCPSLEDIPVAELHEHHPENDFFYGGRYYHDTGHEIPALACNGDSYDRADGYSASADPGTRWSIGSLMVNPGCTWYLFEHYNYEGRYVEFSGGNTGLLVSKVTNPWGQWCHS